jgi:hypothetical protein
LLPTSSSNENRINSGRIFAWLFYLLVALAAIELCFRLIVFPDWRIVSKVPFKTHPIYGTFQKPNLNIRRYNPPNYDVVNRTNSLGFRDREKGFEADLSNIWIAGLSNSYGGFVEDTEVFSRVLEDRYGYRNALLASEGHTIANQVSVMRHLHSQRYKPVIVVLELTLDNALRSYKDSIAILKSPIHIPKSADSAQASERASASLVRRARKIYGDLRHLDFISIKSRLINNSAVYAWLKVGVNAIPAFRAYTLKLGIRADVAVAGSTPIEILKTDGTTAHDYLITELSDYTALIGAWVRANLDADFAVVLIPSSRHLNLDWFARYVRAEGVSGRQMDPARPYRLLKKALEDRGVPVLGMAEPLQNANQFLNFPDDGHLNAVGHALVAKHLAKWLAARFDMKPGNAP